MCASHFTRHNSSITKAIKDRLRGFIISGLICFPAAIGAFYFPAFFLEPKALNALGGFSYIAAILAFIWFGLYAACMAIIPVIFLLAGTEGAREWIRLAALPLIRALTLTQKG